MSLWKGKLLKSELETAAHFSNAVTKLLCYKGEKAAGEYSDRG